MIHTYTNKPLFALKSNFCLLSQNYKICTGINLVFHSRSTNLLFCTLFRHTSEHVRQTNSLSLFIRNSEHLSSSFNITLPHDMQYISVYPFSTSLFNRSIAPLIKRWSLFRTLMILADQRLTLFSFRLLLFLFLDTLIGIRLINYSLTS
jgi:hypothetical protein